MTLGWFVAYWAQLWYHANGVHLDVVGDDLKVGPHVHGGAVGEEQRSRELLRVRLLGIAAHLRAPRSQKLNTRPISLCCLFEVMFLIRSKMANNCWKKLACWSVPALLHGSAEARASGIFHSISIINRRDWTDSARGGRVRAFIKILPNIH